MRSNTTLLLTFLLFGAAGCASTLTVADEQAEDFTVVLIPDTQYYSRDDPETYEKQMQWIVDHESEENIVFSIHLGDITHNNTTIEWERASRAHEILDDADIPYSVCPGNHDNPDSGEKRDTTRYNEWFGSSRFTGKGWYGSGFDGRNDTNFTTFDAAGMKFLVVSLEFSPRKEDLCWADSVIRLHPSHRVIIATHSYLDHGSAYDSDCASAYGLIGSCGETIWEELVRRHSNVFAVVSGHIGDSEYRKDDGLGGNDVHQILTDYQFEQRSGENHGNGWMRTLHFRPQENRVDVRVHTVLSDVSAFNDADYPSDPTHEDHEYTFAYDMNTPTPYAFTNTRERFSDRTVNSDSSGDQTLPSVDVDAIDRSVVVWEDDRDGNGVLQIYARGFDDFGCQRIADFTVNTTATGNQRRPDVACDQSGRFVVAWEDDSNDNDVYQIHARGFDALGNPTIAEFAVNTTPDGQQLRPALARNDIGNFVVVWQDDQDGNGKYQILARGFSASGAETFGSMTINSESDGQQLNPDIAIDEQGNFVVVWEDDQDNNGKYQIYARGFWAGGTERFSDRTVNAVSDGQQLDPSIGMSPDGRFAVAWEDDNDNNGKYQIYLAGFDAAGTKTVSDRTVNTISDGQQLDPGVTLDGDANATVAWCDDNDGNSKYQIHARGFDAAGNQRFSQRTINKTASGQQISAALAASTTGRFMVVWQDDANSNNKYEIVARGLTKAGE